ncbi:MAG: porin family protein [Prevotella sp.]|nr:porin family protein [Prevotellaceae bacterium]MDY3366051.1 porin family protein [Prevotella sp.]MDY3852325.1 porin family protein [Prevotella sp.]
MKRVIVYILILLANFASSASAQERKVENRPYTDLRPFHFGVVVGTHLQDVELMNVGPQTITHEDGTVVQSNIVADQDRYDAGFTVGVLGELRLNKHFQFRVAPAMYFGNRHLSFLNLNEQDAAGKPLEQRQDLKTAYISTALNLIFAAPRFNNHRPYIMAGINPMINLSGKGEDFIRLKRYDMFAEIGLGCDFYLPFFKLRPELKFMFSLVNSLDTNRERSISNKNMLPYILSVKESRTKIIALSFYFE